MRYEFVSRLLLFLALLPLSTQGAAREKEPVPYDLEMVYANPLRDLPAGCHAQVDFYRVVRPILPLVNHIVIGARLLRNCQGEIKESLHVYGASKGASDMAFFRTQMEKDPSGFEYLGRREGTAASHALQKASDVSLAWQESLKNRAYFYPRMLATPVMGRICNNAAEEVIRELELRSLAPPPSTCATTTH